jgi:hypothetical protein
MASSDKRSNPRVRMMLPATMRAKGSPESVLIRDASKRGLLLEADRPPPRGTYIEIKRDSVSLVGRVVWCNGSAFGIRTSDDTNLLGKTAKITVSWKAERSSRTNSAQFPASEESRALAAWLQRLFFTAVAFCSAALLATAVYSHLSGMAEPLVGALPTTPSTSR